MAMVTDVVYTVLGKLINRISVRTLALEVTQECNQDCVFCYNVWKCREYPLGQMETEKTKVLIDRIIRQYRPYVLSFTGGEPLLRADLPELVGYASKRVSCNLISNGTLMTDALARELVHSGVRNFEFTLLSANREIHNSLVRRDSFDSVIEAIASVKAAGGMVTTTFVAMKPNIGGWEDTLELNIALGVDGILFNRFNIGGEGISRAEELAPTVSQLKEALKIADEGAKRFGISISCGVPVPPCLLDRTQYKHVHFGDCPVGTGRAYPTVDPLGNVRHCNHSGLILGNLFESSFTTILQSHLAVAYAADLPTECKGCKHAATCRGGCRAASEACGDFCGIDPFVRLRLDGKEAAECGIFS